MPAWLPKAAIVLASIVMVVIRAPHGHRSQQVKVAQSRKGTLETALLTLAWISFFVPLVWAASSALALADYPARVPVFVAGVIVLAWSLYLFHRSHVDLGTNWSITLEVRESHTLVTRGLYTRVRHPMYLALLLYGLGQALAVPNWIAGPSYLVALGLLVALRLGPEERMMRDRFGADWDAYAASTKRLVPGVW